MRVNAGAACGPSRRRACPAKACCTCGPSYSLRCRRNSRLRFMQDHALERIEFAAPRGVIERTHRRLVTCVPTPANPGCTEINVLGVVLVLEPRGQQPDNVHARQAAVARKFLAAALLRTSSGNSRASSV